MGREGPMSVPRRGMQWPSKGGEGSAFRARAHLPQLDEHEAPAAQHIALHPLDAHHQVGRDEQLRLCGEEGEGAHVASRALAQLNLKDGAVASVADKVHDHIQCTFCRA